MEPDVKVQTETASGERIWTGIAGMESRSAKGISRWCKESGFHGRFGLFAGKRNKIRDTATSDLEARKGKKKGLREERPTVPHNPQRHSSPDARQTQAKTGKPVAEGVQSAASSVAGSASTVTPATLATRTAKKTAQTFKNYVQEVNQAAQQAIGEERAKLEDTKQQNAQVGDIPSFVKYLGATIGSVVLVGAAMVMQLAAALLTVLVTMLAFLLVAVLAISLIVSVILSLIGGFLDQQPATGHGLPPFITEDMMEAFFAVQEESGIPVSTGVAQVIAESGFGLYGPGGDNGQGLSQLAYEYKNLFGIKYFSGDKYAIGGVDLSTGEETGNGNTTITAAFAVYPDYGAVSAERMDVEPGTLCK